MDGMIAVAVVDLKAGPALDWAVAKALGLDGEDQLDLSIQFRDGNAVLETVEDIPGACPCYRVDWSPSTDWAHGGPLIEKTPFVMLQKHDGVAPTLFTIGSPNGHGHVDFRSCDGATILEAACKAIVAHKFGDAVTVPRELVEVQS